MPKPSKLGRCIPLVELIFTVAGQLALLLLGEQPLLAAQCMPCCAILYAHFVSPGFLLLRVGFQQTRQGLMYRCRGDVYREFNRSICSRCQIYRSINLSRFGGKLAMTGIEKGI